MSGRIANRDAVVRRAVVADSAMGDADAGQRQRCRAGRVVVVETGPVAGQIGHRLPFGTPDLVGRRADHFRRRAAGRNAARCGRNRRSEASAQTSGRRRRKHLQLLLSRIFRHFGHLRVTSIILITLIPIFKIQQMNKISMEEKIKIALRTESYRCGRAIFVVGSVVVVGSWPIGSVSDYARRTMASQWTEAKRSPIHVAVVAAAAGGSN